MFSKTTMVPCLVIPLFRCCKCSAFSLPEFLDLIFFWEDQFGGKQSILALFFSGPSTQEVSVSIQVYLNEAEGRVEASGGD